MPVYYCAGTSGCQRLISVTSVPGGNPMALADPEGYASQWTLCSACRSFTCDRCLAQQQGRCKCGAGVRLYTEAERLATAQGGPPIPATLIAPAAPASPPLRQVLEDLVHQTDAELKTHGHERARALAELAATLMVGQGANAPITDLHWFMRVGEQFYRWRFFAEGAQFWKGLYQIAEAHGAGQTDDAIRIMASAAAFQVLSGEVTAASPDVANTVNFITRVFGPGHILTQEALQRLGAAPPASPAPVVPPVIAQPAPPPAAAATAGLDPATKNALWVTLAFLEIAMADGKLLDEEWAAWRRTMEKFRLPNIWERFGHEALQQMRQQGVLAQLTSELSYLPIEKRGELAEILLEFVVADGKIDPGEPEALDRITGWLGVSVRMPGH